MRVNRCVFTYAIWIYKPRYLEVDEQIDDISLEEEAINLMLAWQMNKSLLIDREQLLAPFGQVGKINLASSNNTGLS